MGKHFDAEAAEEGKREGMARAEQGSDLDWWHVMLACIKAVAERRPWFIFDAVEKYRIEHYPHHFTPENRAHGPLMKEAQRLGYCEPTDEWHESKQRQNHRRPMRMWESLIYKGPTPRVRPRRRRIDPHQFDMFS